LSDNLIKLGYLQQVYLKGGRFPMQVVKVTKMGISWASMGELNDLLDDLSYSKLPPIKMTTSI